MVFFLQYFRPRSSPFREHTHTLPPQTLSSTEPVTLAFAHPTQGSRADGATLSQRGLCETLPGTLRVSVSLPPSLPWTQELLQPRGAQEEEMLVFLEWPWRRARQQGKSVGKANQSLPISSGQRPAPPLITQPTNLALLFCCNQQNPYH